MKKIILLAGFFAMTSSLAFAQDAKGKKACTKDKKGACCAKDNKKTAKAENASKLSCCDKEHGTAANLEAGHSDLQMNDAATKTIAPQPDKVAPAPARQAGKM